MTKNDPTGRYGIEGIPSDWVSPKELPSHYQSVIHRSRYARYVPELQRRETWTETIDRYINYMYQKVKDNPNVSEEDRKYIHGILGATCDL